MKEFLNRNVQAVFDFIIGMAVYFGSIALFPDIPTSLATALALICAVEFAEHVEVKNKK